jgi:phage terminase large subunit
MKHDYEASVLFRHNYDSIAAVVVNQGGTSSGKTYAIEQVLFCKACEAKDQVITVVGQDIPNLKAGALRDALSIYNKSAQLKNLVKNFNKSDRVFEFYNGSIRYLDDIKVNMAITTLLL